MLFLYSIVFLILCLYGLKIYLYNNEKTRCINTIPGPIHLPFIGNILQLPSNPAHLFESFRTRTTKYYPVYKLWIGLKPVVVIHHPDDLEIILSSPKHVTKEFAYENLKSWLQDGLLISKVSLWQQRRKILTKAFHFKILQKYMHIMNERGQQLIKNNRAGEKETTKVLLPFCAAYTLDIICESAMGISIDDSKTQESAKTYKNAISKIVSILTYRIIRPYIKDWMLPFLPKLNKENKETLNDLLLFTNKIVQDRREYHKSTNYASLEELHDDDTSEFDNNLDEFDIYGQQKKLSMLDLLLKCEKNGLIDDKGIKEEVSTFVFEGHDTTGTALCFIIMLLAENKFVQDKARAEVEEIFNTSNGKLTMSDLQKMTYLERCIKESLRLYPSIPYIARYILEDVQLKHCKVPKNTNILLNIFEVHRHPDYWPEPEKFNPDRFLIENIKKRHPYSYIPFSAGPRNCIGQKFSMMELKSTVAKILYNFYLEPVTLIKDINLITDIILHADAPIHTKFIRIDRIET